MSEILNKKALVEVEGDIEKAIELLREKGMAKAAKKMGIPDASDRIIEVINTII